MSTLIFTYVIDLITKSIIIFSINKNKHVSNGEFIDKENVSAHERDYITFLYTL